MEIFKKKKAVEKEQITTKKPPLPQEGAARKMPEPSKEEEAFRRMNGFYESTSKDSLKKESTSDHSHITDSSKGEGGVPKNLYPKFPPYKRLVNKKLTIFLIEDSISVAKEKERILQMIHAIPKSDSVCVISYNDIVRTTKIMEMSDKQMEFSILQQDVVSTDKLCLYDALRIVERTVLRNYLITTEGEKERVCIDHIDIIGIGSCSDIGSKASKEDALDSFFRVAFKKNIVTKYFCLSDEYFLQAAELGFHSIGAISIQYQ